jgi:hypothetical protein
MSFLIDFGVKATAALGLAFLVALALKRASASARYAMWTCALAAVLVLPVASSIGPGLKMTVGRSAWLRATTTITAAPRTVQDAAPISVVVEGRRPASRLPMMIWIAGIIA